jgi:hypothetical protein
MMFRNAEQHKPAPPPPTPRYKHLSGTILHFRVAYNSLDPQHSILRLFMKTPNFRNTAPCSPVKLNGRFGGI